jgi:ACS family hexuronate transporter-like MFS transporter
MPLSRRHAWLVAIVATLAMSVSYVDRQVVSAIGTSVRTALHFDATHYGWLAGAFSASYMVAAPAAGALLDRVGARRGLTAAIVVWSLVSAAHALAPTFAALLVMRIALGAAEAPSFPGAAQAVRRALPARDRSAAFGVLFTGSSLGAFVAPRLAVALDVRFGWQAAFAITAVIGMAWLPLWLLVTAPRAARDALATPAPEPDVPSAAPPALTLARHAGVLRTVVLILASAPALMFLYIWMPQYLELVRGVPHAEVGSYVSWPPLASDAGMLAFGALGSVFDRPAAGAAKRSHVGLVIAAAVLGSAILAVPYAPGAWSAVALVSVSAAGCGALYTLLTADVMARVHPRHVSIVGGICAASQSFTYVALNPIIGAWWDRTHSLDGALFFVGAIVMPGAIAWSVWPRANELTARG